MNINYEIVFVVEVLNEYFANLECPALDIIPADDTYSLLKGQQMLCKTIGNKFIVINKIDDTGKPFIALSNKAIQRFYISINDVDFSNYSNINYRPLTSAKYYFTNLNQTKLGSALYLTKAVKKYDNTQTYQIGDLAADNTGNIFEATKKSDHTNKHALTDTAYWLPKGKAQFVNNGDSLLFTGSNYIITATTPATDFTINIYGLNTSTNVYDLVVRSETQHYNATQAAIPVDLSGLAFGKYKITVNADTAFVYYDDIAVKQNILGVIDIFNHLPPANAFSLFNNTGVAKQNTFTLRFANRSAIWRYFARTTDVKDVKDTASVYTFSIDAANKIFASMAPIPLKELPITTLSVETIKHGTITPIANPGVNRLSSITQNGELYYCIEKHLNF
jgi:hypothetical protein